MNLYLALAAITAVFVFLGTMLSHDRYRRNRGSQTARTVWLVAAMTTGTMLVFIGATVVDLIPEATVIDVAALALTGILTGFFLALALWPTDSQHAKN